MMEEKLISLNVREFALPVPRRGSIDALSGFGKSALIGIEMHQQIQAQRLEKEATYQSEIPIEQRFNREGYVFKVSGRMDGLFQGPSPKIEEIKTTFNIRELIRRLKEGPHHHPYCLQLKTYGYFYWIEHRVLPELTFHIASTRKSESQDLEIKLEIETYEAWLESRLEELVQEAKRAEKRTARRKAAALQLRFPYRAPRKGQLDLIDQVEKSFEAKEPLFIQAPTGLGKTMGVLYPSLKEALSRGHNLLYVTPKNSQHLVAEDAISRLQENGAKIRSLTLTAKSKICFKNEPLCDPQYCEYAKDHYTKAAAANLPEVLSKKRKLTSRVFRKIASDHQVCPFELQLDALSDVDAVICDYNYVFSPRACLQPKPVCSVDQQGKSNLVIDEAHNLPARAMDYFSPSLSSSTLQKFKDALNTFPKRLKEEAGQLIDECIQAIQECAPADSTHASLITPPLDVFSDLDQRLRGFLSRYLEGDTEILAGDPILKLSFYWSEFTRALELASEPGQEAFFTTYQPISTGAAIRITCCDASELIKPCYDEFENVVAFSATLKPFDYYATLSGLDPLRLKTAEFSSPFPKEKRKVLIIPQISSKYSDRKQSTPKIAEAIRKIAEVRSGNYFVFFPSFEFMEQVLRQFIAPTGFHVIRQFPRMKPDEVEKILSHLKFQSVPTLVFAVQGGVFSEGVDYPGEMIIGAFVVGPPLPVFDLEREKMKEYYERHYHSGFDFAYTFPAMAKAIQAAGRVIRSETDQGLIVLMDQRFTHPNYYKSMPKDWFYEHPRELVSTQILKEISDFWGQAQWNAGGGSLAGKDSQDISST